MRESATFTKYEEIYFYVYYLFFSLNDVSINRYCPVSSLLLLENNLLYDYNILYLNQNVSTSILLTFKARKFFVVGGSNVHCMGFITVSVRDTVASFPKLWWQTMSPDISNCLLWTILPLVENRWSNKLAIVWLFGFLFCHNLKQ